MKAFEDRRLWIGGATTAAVLVLIGGWLLLIAPEHSTIPELHAEAAAAQTQNAQLQSQVTALRRQSARMPALVAQLRTVRTQLPIHAALPAVIDQIDAQARRAGLVITGLTIGSVTAATVATTGSTDPTSTGTTDSGATGSGTADSGSGASGTATDSGTTGSGATGSGTTADSGLTGTGTAAAGPAGQLFQIQLTVVTTGSLRQQEAFLAAVQYGGARAALVSSTQLAPPQGSESKTIGLSSDMTTQLAIYVAPQTPAVAAQLAKQLSARPLR